ncbi:hypothetical protein MNBD_DELTA01-32 [hydrothermal vent metagenome]|uniref:Uncharacterized protein n=1 Tax=hydrothermal vent metagenome TaxID=652676 RepID=A0A3B0QKX7_9ZZZZ
MVQHGSSDKEWQLAKREALKVLRECAEMEETIFYSDLVTEIKSVKFLCFRQPFFKFLAELSTEENETDKGMFTVLVVRKKDRRPGNGFFVLAKKLRYRFRSEEQFVKKQRKKIFEFYFKSN